MSYTVLARRYRSATLDEVIGQDHIAQTLKKAITSGRIAHAYLFCGTRGTGKTSTARILAKGLNCDKSDKPTTEPCGKCNSCQAIARGDDIDVIEIDAASNTGVDNVRDIIANAQYRPARSRFKVYIIDEVHMLSKAAFNALLKIMEEPPEHVKFILATTEPEKVLPTILSRCQRYDFRNIPTREIAKHLTDICKKEKIKADEDAIMLVAKAGAGSMRDALSLLDRLLSVGEKDLTVDMIEQLLGLPKSQLLLDLAGSIADGDVKKTLEQAEKILAGGLSVDALIVAMVDHFRNLMIISACGLESHLVEVPGVPPNDLKAQAGKYDTGALVQNITILEEIRRQLRTTSAGRALFDATLVRLALSEQFASIGDLVAELGGAGPGDAQKKKLAEPLSVAGAPLPAGRVGVPAHAVAMDEKVATDENICTSQSTVGEYAQPADLPTGESELPADNSQSPTDNASDDSLPAVGKVFEGPKQSLGAIFKASRSARPGPSAAPSNLAPVGNDELSKIWGDVLNRFSDSPGISGLLTHGRLVKLDDERATIEFPADHSAMPRMLETGGKRDRVRDVLTAALGRAVGVAFEVSSAPAAVVETRPGAPANLPVRKEIAKPQQQQVPEIQSIPLTADLKAELAKDPLVKAVMETLGADIVRVE